MLRQRAHIESRESQPRESDRGRRRAHSFHFFRLECSLRPEAVPGLSEGGAPSQLGCGGSSPSREGQRGPSDGEGPAAATRTVPCPGRPPDAQGVRRRAPGRTPRPGARGPFCAARACQASHAPCPGSQVWVTGIDHLDPAYSHCSRVGGVSGVSGVRGVSDPLPGSWPQPSIHGQVPPAELIRNSNARPCTSASGGGGVDTRGRETRLARERARTPGPRASSPCGPAVSTATLRPPRTEVATRRGPPLRTREPALPGALRAAL